VTQCSVSRRSVARDGGGLSERGAWQVMKGRYEAILHAIESAPVLTPKAKVLPRTPFSDGATLEATQGQILSQSPTDATRLWWHVYGS